MSFEFADLLRTRALGRVIERHDSIASTNDRAKVLAKNGAAHGLAVIAQEQTTGRGQRGRNWHSARGLGLYVSFVLRPTLALKAAPLLPLMSGLATFEAIKNATRLRPLIKWPNDLLVREDLPMEHGRKVAGVLVEMVAGSDSIDHAVVGIGLNVREGPRPPELEHYAGSLDRWLKARGDHDVSLDSAWLLAALANALEKVLDEADERFDAILARISRELAGVGEEVDLDVDGKIIHGVLKGVAADGALLLETSSGTECCYRGELIVPRCPKRPTSN